MSLAAMKQKEQPSKTSNCFAQLPFDEQMALLQVFKAELSKEKARLRRHKRQIDLMLGIKRSKNL